MSETIEFGGFIPDDVERVSGPGAEGTTYVRADNGYFKLSTDPDDRTGYLSANTSRGEAGLKGFPHPWFVWEFPLTVEDRSA